MEVRLAIALLVSTFDTSFALGESREAVCKDTLDLFVATPGPLQLCFNEQTDVV